MYIARFALACAGAVTCAGAQWPRRTAVAVHHGPLVGYVLVQECVLPTHTGRLGPACHAVVMLCSTVMMVMHKHSDDDAQYSDDDDAQCSDDAQAR